MTRSVTVMRALELGEPEVLQPTVVELPDPGVDQVQIDVKAIGVNPLDLKMRSGFAWADQAALPFTPGAEIAGVVAAVGADVTHVRPDDEVVAFRIMGGYATAVNVRAVDVLLKPAEVSFIDAAGLLLVGVTAEHCLARVGAQRGDRILVHGISGSVGQALAQLASDRGITLVGTASERNHELVRSLGAIAITYGDGLLGRAEAEGPFDGAIDLVGTEEAFEVSLALVADRDRITTIIGGPNAHAAGIQKIGGGPGSDLGTELRDAARQGLLDMAAAGKYSARVVRTFELTQAPAAHHFVADGHAAGKVILVP